MYKYSWPTRSFHLHFKYADNTRLITHAKSQWVGSKTDATVLHKNPVSFVVYTHFNGLVQDCSIKVNDPHFQYQLRESKEPYLVQIWWF